MEPFLKLITILIKFGMQMKDALADKKIRFGEVLQLITSAWGIWQPIQDWDEIKGVLMNFTPERRAETIAHVKDKLDLPDEEVEKLVEEGVEVLLAMYSFIMNIVNKD
jgi:hypothetical protein